MTLGEAFLLLCLYKCMPADGRRMAERNVKRAMSNSFSFIVLLPRLIKNIGRNIIRPDYVDIRPQNIIIADTDGPAGLYDAMLKAGEIFFDPTKRVISTLHFDIDDSSNAGNVSELKKIVADFEKLSMAHEMHHAAVSKYSTSIFWRKRNFYYIAVLDEISSIIQEQVAYLGMKECGDSASYWANRVHSKIIKTPGFRGCGSDISGPKYLARFNDVAAADKYARGAIINGALKRFECFLADWGESIANLKQAHMPFCVDFWRAPVSFNRARRKMLTYNIGGKTVCFYDSMTKSEKARFDARIYAIADIICEKSAQQR